MIGRRSSPGLAFRVVAGVVCVAMAAPLPAHAFEIFGLKLFGRDEPAEEDLVIGEPQNYDVEFAVSEDEDGLEGAIVVN